MSLTLCEPETHKTLLFSTQKVGERTSEVQLDETVLKMGNNVLFQATWSVLSQGEFWECCGKSKARNGYKSRLVYSALCSPHSTGNYVEMTKGRIKTSKRAQLVMRAELYTLKSLQTAFRRIFHSHLPAPCKPPRILNWHHVTVKHKHFNHWSETDSGTQKCEHWTIDQTIPTLISQKHIVIYLQLIKQYWSPTVPKHINTLFCVFSEPQSRVSRLGCLNPVPCSY